MAFQRQASRFLGGLMALLYRALRIRTLKNKGFEGTLRVQTLVIEGSTPYKEGPFGSLGRLSIRGVYSVPPTEPGPGQGST